MLVDTDVLIRYLRGDPRASRRLDAIDGLTLSAVTYLELLQGLRNKGELHAIQQMLQRRGAAVLPLSQAITERAIVLMETLTLSHGLQMGDALIAATALELSLPLLTANVRHFAAVEGLVIDAFNP